MDGGDCTLSGESGLNIFCWIFYGAERSGVSVGSAGVLMLYILESFQCCSEEIKNGEEFDASLRERSLCFQGCGWFLLPA